MAEKFYDQAMAEQQERLAKTADMVRQRQILREALALSAGESVLDIGAGNGIFSRDLCEDVGETGKVVGVDSAEAMISMAKGLCPGAEFKHADASVLPFEEAIFDAVSAAQLLCFLPDVPKALSEMWRVLKPGGRLVVLDTDWRSLVWNTYQPDLMERVIESYTAVYVDAHIPSTLSRKLNETGFTITDRFCFTVLNWIPDEASYAKQTVGFAVPIMQKSPHFSEEDIKCWLDDQSDVENRGEYMFSLSRFVFKATK